MPITRGRILVVDDDQEWAEAMADVLRSEGYSVLVAPNGLAALEALTQMQPLVVMTDLQMPLMDGRQLLVRVHEHDGRVPVIVVSGECLPEQDRSLAGAFRVMSKTVPIQDVLASLAAAAAHRTVRLPLQKLWNAAGAIPPQTKRLPHPRWRALRRLTSSVPPAAFVLLTLVLASSFVFFKYRQAKLT